MPAKKKPKPIKTIVVISDTHVGSTVGLLPPGFVTLEGNEVKQNKIQEWLWGCWSDLWENWIPQQVAGKDFAVVMNGDLVDGIHHMSTQVISPDIGDHIRASKETFKIVKKSGPSKMFITEGTESHTKNVETAIGEAVGAEMDPKSRRYAFEKLTLNCHGNLCVFLHHMPTTTRPYLEATALGVCLNVARVEAARNGQEIPKVICCAHRHRHGYFSDGCGLFAVTGPFQALTRFGMKVVPHAVPMPSCVVLDWSEKEYGELPHVIEKIYQPKQSQAHIVRL